MILKNKSRTPRYRGVRDKKITYLLVSALLVVFALQAIFSLLQKSPTDDEPRKISAGYSHLIKRDLRMNQDHPPLIKIWTALPLVFLDLDGKFETEAFQEGMSSQQEYSNDFIYNNKVSTEKIILFARTPIVILGIFLGIYVFLWAKELFGIKSALLALTFYSFSPTILAHSRVATNDIGVTLFIFISSYYFWKLYKHKLWKYAFICGFFLGLAQTSKFTAAYMAPFLLVITVIQIIIDLKKKDKIWKKRILWLILIFFIAWVIIWLFYLPFGRPYLYNFELLKKDVEEYYELKDFFAFYIMPHYYARGASELLAHTQEGHKSFFFGEVSREGWWYYYLASYFIKTPLAFLIILIFYFFFKIFRGGNDLKKIHFMIFLLPLLILLWTSFLNKVNIGIRHVLPMFPFIFVFTSEIINVKLKEKKRQKMLYVVLGILIIWYVGNSFWIYPDYLMHFNQLVGGPENGWKYSVLGDDWGQDDLKLVKWMKENGYKEFNFVPPGIYSKKYFEKRGLKTNRPLCSRKKGALYHFNKKLPLAIHVVRIQTRPQCYERLLKHKPLAKIGYAIFVYDFQKQNIDVDKIINP